MAIRTNIEHKYFFINVNPIIAPDSIFSKETVEKVTVFYALYSQTIISKFENFLLQFISILKQKKATSI